jgi:hypothetical protein
MRLRLAFAVVVGLTRAVVAADGYTCEFGRVPPWAVAGRQITVEMRYTTPAGAAPAALHCEMKSGDGRYLSGQVATVSGTGTQAFTVDVPADAAVRQLELVGWFGEDWRQPFSAFSRPPLIEVLSAERGKEMDIMQAQSLVTRQQLAAARTPTGLVGIYQAPESAWTGSLADELRRLLQAAGYGVATVDNALLANPFVLTPDAFDILILCDPRQVPATAPVAVARFLGAGGKAIFLGGPAFETLTWQFEGRWLPTAAYRAALAATLKTNVLLDFERDSGGEWVRGSNRPDSPTVLERATPGADGSAGCLHLSIADLTGWDTFRSPLPTSPFPAGHAWTVFRARGDKGTSELALEWTEKDGSRWIAVTPITPEWQPVALPPEAFRYWHDSASEGRGGVGDSFNPENAATLTIGLALTHTTAVGGGRHEFWVDSLGTAPAPAAGVRDALAQGLQEATPIEAVSPRYKLYSVSNLATLKANPVQALVPTPPGLRAATTLAPHPRPQGTGIRKERRWRFVPLLDALAADGRVCGEAAALVLSGPTPAAGGAVVSVPVTDPAFFAAAAAPAWFADLARRLDDGFFLYEGGTAYYASFGSETMPVGALISNRGRQPQRGEVEARVTDAAGKTVWEQRWPVEVAPGASARVEATWPVPATAAGAFQVTVELSRDGAVVDRLVHEFGLWAPPATPRFVSREKGEFRRDGKPWFAHGVNYMPSTGIGIEDTPYFENWLDPQPYDPELIERDLADIEAIGFNMVSVFQYRCSMPSRNLLDLLRRCQAHGLLVNLSLRPGTPMDFPWDLVQEMIEFGRLAQNDTVFAYDLAWEPFWHEYKVRMAHDGDWAAWVAQRYGNLAAAEKAWGCPAPRRDEALTSPADDQVSKDGPWRLLVLDYRQFQNDLLHERYSRARDLVRSIDPNHLVSFRMSIAGDPTVDPAAMPYDFAGLARAVDILEPEGYGRIGDWERVKPGWFTTAYGRCVAPELPVMWAEFGTSVWTGVQQDQARLDYAARFYDDFYRMAYESGANGTVCWWFPGGYRANERSDYGILNPDRSWRPVTTVIKRWAPRFTAPRPNPTPAVWLPVELNRDVDGLPGLYARLKDDFWKAVDAGKLPGLRPSTPVAPR